VPSNLLLFLPLLGGYTFIHLFHFTRFRAQSLTGYNLVFEASLAGFLSVAFTRCVIWCVDALGWGGGLRAWVTDHMGATPYLGTVVGGFLVAPLAAVVCNLAVGIWQSRHPRTGQGGTPGLPGDLAVAGSGNREQTRHEETPGLFELSQRVALDRAIRNSGNDLLIFLHDAAHRAQTDKMTALLSMSDRKVYVGWVTRSPSLRPGDQFVRILPLMSGCRGHDDLGVRFTTFYPDERYLRECPEEQRKSFQHLQPEDFAVIVPLSEIRDAHYFDLNFYSAFFSQQVNEKPSTSGRRRKKSPSGR